MATTRTKTKSGAVRVRREAPPAEPKRKVSRSTIFTEVGVKRLALPEVGQVDWFEKLRRGLTLVLRISYGGTRAWRVTYYVDGAARSRTIGRYPEMGVAAARKAAYAFDPKAATASAEAGSFREVAENWIKRHVDEKGLRSKREIERQLRYYVYPRWERLPFFSIGRKTVNELLDEIVDEHGASQADGVLATLRGIMNWYMSRDENYVSPIVKGMKRDRRPPSERNRERILSDEELYLIWGVTARADGMGAFGGIVRLLLLTAQRVGKVSTMKWADVDLETGVWTIATEVREKGNAGRLKLPPLALAVIEEQPIIEGNPYIFAGSIRGRRHPSAAKDEPPRFNSFSQYKLALDDYFQDWPRWTLHDLRRTARSLMSRAGVADNIAERVLGHAIAGVEGTYNRYDYFDEKADALRRLAGMIERIVTGVSAEVVELKRRRVTGTIRVPR